MSLGELTWALAIQLPWDNNPLTCGSTLLKGYRVCKVSVHSSDGRRTTMKKKKRSARKVYRFCLVFLYAQGQYMRRHHGDMVGRASHS